MKTLHPCRRPGASLTFSAALVAAALACLLAPARARAADCPSSLPESTRTRRTLARDWFGRAESAEAAGRDEAAVKAYACSLAIVPHAFTAYNLARAAERAGDLETALRAYREYLKLQPTASDRTEVEERVITLEARLDATLDPPPAGEPEPPPPPASSPPRPPAAKPAAAALKLAAADHRRPAAEESAPPPLMSTTAWVVGGVGAAAVITGLVFNIGAHRASRECDALNAISSDSPAWPSCDRGQRFAYTSYSLFGVAAVAAAVDVMLILDRSRKGESVRVAWLPGGAALIAAGRF